MAKARSPIELGVKERPCQRTRSMEHANQTMKALIKGERALTMFELVK